MQEDEPDHWQVEHSRYLSQKPWLTLRQDRVRLPNGVAIDDYFVLEYPAWVNVLAITIDGQVVMIRQYRHGLQAVHYELPGGVCEPSEELLLSAQRELMEETGYGGGSWSPFLTLSANPATHSNLTHTFLARDVELTQAPSLEKTEDLAVRLVPVAELRDIALNGGIIQSLHAAPIFKYLLLKMTRSEER